MQVEPEILLDRITAEIVKVLGTKLVGIYLHGSLAMGCFNFKSSDIDFLVIINEDIASNQKKGNYYKHVESFCHSSWKRVGNERFVGKRIDRF